MLRIVYRLVLRMLSWLVVLLGIVLILAYVFEESSNVFATVLLGSAVLLAGARGLRSTSAAAWARSRGGRKGQPAATDGRKGQPAATDGRKGQPAATDGRKGQPAATDGREGEPRSADARAEGAARKLQG